MSDYPNCPLCKDSQVVLENDLAYVLFDTNPVSPGHCLVVPKRHVAEYFDASQEEKNAIWALVDGMKEILDKKHSPDAYNVGINIGKLAGQSVPHIHVHIIPRYEGDMDDPRGGVRGVIPNRQKYPRQPPK